MNFLSRLLTIAGLIFIMFGLYLLSQRYSPNKLSFNDLSANTVSVSGQMPEKIVIPSLNLNLPVYPAQIKDNEWEATAKGVSYLISSPVPGEIGNSVIYGHNWSSLLGPLVRIKPGDKIEVVMDSGDKKTFVVNFTTLVDPSQTGILAASDDARITIYTCAGFLDSKRFVATAILQ